MALKADRGRIRVVMAGPLPPAIGGMTSVISDLSESTLRESVKVDLFDTAKQTRADRSLREAIGVRFDMWQRWTKVLRSRDLHVAHVHTCSGLSYFLDGVLVMTARMCRVPVVLHIHGGRFDQFLDELDPLRRWLARLIARRAARVVVLSESWRERLATRLPGAQMSVVENGVPVPVRTLDQRAPSEPLILFLGAICRSKGIEDLIRAASCLPESSRVVLVGPETEKGFLQTMTSLVSDLGLENRVEFAGPAQSSDKAVWLARAMIFVLPSYVEALPISILEAMAVGVPVVATSVGAVPSVIENERTGLLVAPGDVEALAVALNRLLADPTLRTDLTSRARLECTERFSIDRAATQLREIYAEIC